MKKKAFIPTSALMVALLLAFVAAITLFVAEPERVHAQAPNDANLSNLTLSVGKLNPVFSAATDTYTATVAHQYSTVRVTATPNIQGAQVRINHGGTVSAGDSGSITGGTDVSPGGSIPLTVTTDTVIGILVTALDGTTTRVYQVTIDRISAEASNDAKLATEGGLTISAGALSPTYKQNVKSYTALVANTVGTTGSPFTVTPTLSDATNASLVITSDRASGITTAASGDPTTVPLSVGANVITIKVTAENLVTTDTYTLTVTRAAGNASDDARLSSITLSGLTLSPAFKSDVTNYSVSVPFSKTETAVTFSKNRSGALAVVSPEDFNPRTSAHEVFLRVGDTSITIAVTAEDATTTETYTLTVTRAAVNASNNAKLNAGNGLVISAGTLSPAFDQNVMSYTALVANTVGTTGTPFTVTPTIATNANSSFVITSDKDANVDTQASGAPTTVALSVGANVITIQVTAEDSVATETYTVTVMRAAGNASDDTRLSSLTVGGESVDVSSLTSGAVIHTAGVPNGVNSITVEATPNHSGAIVVIKSGATVGTAASGTVADGTVDLNITTDPTSPNVIGIEVTAEDGATVGYYFLQITRATATASNNAKLNAGNGLVISAGTLSPAFDQNVMSYTALVANTVGTTGTPFTVTPTIATDANSSFVITSDKASNITTAASEAPTTVPLSVGANVITIKVTAQDLATTETYTVTVMRAAGNASNDTSLSSLTVGGESVDVSSLTSGAVIHTAGVPNGVNSITVEANPNHSGAMVVIKSGATVGTAASGTADADGTVALNVTTDPTAPNVIGIEVTAEDGATVGYYFLQITRASASASNNAKLSALAMSGITLTPAFSPNTTMYTAEVPVNISSTTVLATAAGAAPTANASSVVITSDTDDMLGPDSNTADAHITGHTIALSLGDNVITIVVVAQDYATMETYTVTVQRGPSNNAYLSSLSLTDDMGEAVDLKDMNDMMAEFMSGIDMYYASVDGDVEMVTVSAMAMDSDATVSGDGDVSLETGENTITVTVTAEDGTTMMTYTIMVTVGDPPPTPGGDLLERYDADDSGHIDSAEATQAVLDYQAGTLSREDAVQVILLYHGS